MFSKKVESKRKESHLKLVLPMKNLKSYKSCPDSAFYLRGLLVSTSHMRQHSMQGKNTQREDNRHFMVKIMKINNLSEADITDFCHS